MTSKDLREMETKKLHEQLAELREKVRGLRFGLGSREVKNVREVRTNKREVARIMTELNVRRDAAAKETSKT